MRKTLIDLIKVTKVNNFPVGAQRAVPSSLKTKDFEYDLPRELIAQHPAERRDSSRLMVLDRAEGTIRHRMFSDLPEYVSAGDLLVLNNTRVFPARLLGRFPTGGAFEVFLVRRLDNDRWLALVKPGRRIKPGKRLLLGNGFLQVVVEDFSGTEGERIVRLEAKDSRDPLVLVELYGHVPLPPYISRPDNDEDRLRYQTIYARFTGAVAAPTAGLHFTPKVMEAVRERGADFTEITLHVGPGTFRPVVTESVAGHKMEEEYYSIDQAAISWIIETKKKGGKIIAVGTTSVRALETAAGDPGFGKGQQDGPLAGWTGLFIYPGYSFRMVDSLLTNFHLPRSTLLMLVSAFAGKTLIDFAYREAVNEGYRFYSYGDAMLIV